MMKSNLTQKETEIINLGASIVAGCQPCTKYHVKKCKNTGLSDKEINDVINKTEQLFNKAKEIMIVKALKSLDCSNEKDIEFIIKSINRNDILLGITISYTVNNTTLLEEFIKHADNVEIGKKEISNIIEMTKFIYSKAKAHVDIISEEIGIEKENNEDDDCSPSCRC